jgi:hypothetical protein
MFIFSASRKTSLLKNCSYSEDLRITTQRFIVSRWLVRVLHPPHMFECPTFWNDWSYESKNYGVEVTFNGMTSLPNFKNIPLGSKVDGGTDTYTDRKVIS